MTGFDTHLPFPDDPAGHARAGEGAFNLPFPLAIAAASGGFKCIFVHGVLVALERAGVRAAAYAAASASVLPTAYAAIGAASGLGPAYWDAGRRVLEEPGCGMSDVILRGLAAYAPRVRAELFAPGMPRMLIGASAVVTGEGAEATQGERPTAIGRRLLVDFARRDRSWVQKHFRPVIFDSSPEPGNVRRHDPEGIVSRPDTSAPDRSTSETACRAEWLTAANFDEVAYASSRMLHAWKVPATIEGRPYVDASYTCSCHAEELARLGYGTVVAIGTEPAVLHRDLVGDLTIPACLGAASIHAILPEVDTREMGVDFTKATPEGIERVFLHGLERGRAFLLDFPRRTDTG